MTSSREGGQPRARLWRCGGLDGVLYVGEHAGQLLEVDLSGKTIEIYRGDACHRAPPYGTWVEAEQDAGGHWVVVDWQLARARETDDAWQG